MTNTFMTGQAVTVPDPYQYDGDRITVTIVAYNEQEKTVLVMHENGYTEEHKATDIEGGKEQ